MSSFDAFDSEMMARALRLAENGRFTSKPNPVVGCVLVKDGEVVGEGWHRAAGEAHAEVHALRSAGQRASGATAYVTLEPCAHHGRTPPCSQALIDAGIAAVVVAVEDPFETGSGKGVAALRAAGVEVRVGLMRASASEMMRGFFSRIRRGRPFVCLKLGCSLDGAIAMANGASQWITGAEARTDVQRLRARCGAVMTGIGTVLADDPSLNVRDDRLGVGGEQPLRVVLDSQLRMPLSAKMLALPGTTLIACSNDARSAELAEAGAEIVVVPGDEDRVSVLHVLELLAKREINDVLVEAGPRLAGSLIEQKLVDELVIYQAPHMMGSETLRMIETPGWTELANRALLDVRDRRMLGNDLRITAKLSG